MVVQAFSSAAIENIQTKLFIVQIIKLVFSKSYCVSVRFNIDLALPAIEPDADLAPVREAPGSGRGDFRLAPALPSGTHR